VAVDKQRKPVCRKRQKDRPSLRGKRGSLRQRPVNLSLSLSRKAISGSRVRPMELNWLGSNPASDTYPCDTG